MFKKTTPFQLIVLSVFGILALISVGLFASYQAGSGEVPVGSVSIWGTLDDRIMRDALGELALGDLRFDLVTYEQINPDSFVQRTLEGFATGDGPDLMLIDDSQLYYYLDKIYGFDPAVYPVSAFQNNFVDSAGIFLSGSNVIGLPIMADPLVMYWNRDLYANAGLARPPSQWGEFFSLTDTLAEVDVDLNISQSVIGLGEAQNVNNIREILATLFLQEQNPITAYDSVRDRYVPTLTGTRSAPSIESSLRFYTEFSNPTRAAYSWNRSLPSTDQAFLSGTLATYLGMSSEIDDLRRRNPNLNFALAEIPSVTAEANTPKSVYTKIYGLVMPRSTDNAYGAQVIASLLAQVDNADIFVNSVGLTPVHRDLVSQPSQEGYQDILKRQVIYGDTFLDPNPRVTERAFEDMIENITSGRQSLNQSINIANNEISREL